jgi:signal transduction histidine kinase
LIQSSGNRLWRSVVVAVDNGKAPIEKWGESVMSRLEAKHKPPRQYTSPARADVSSPAELLAESTAGIAHDVANLLQIASSEINIVARTPSVRTVAALDPVIAGAKLSLERAGALIDRITHTARDRNTVVEHASVTACLTEVAALIRGSWDARFYLDIDASPSLPMVKCSPTDLQNAILNIVFNARAAMPSGGAISVTAVEVFLRPRLSGVEIRIQDTGFGMTPDTMLRAFDPFFTTKTTGLGGLGLPIVKRFVLEVGGRIDIESEPGVGTAVILRLPGSAPSPNSRPK